jgi:hypothetical protein
MLNIYLAKNELCQSQPRVKNSAPMMIKQKKRIIVNLSILFLHFSIIYSGDIIIIIIVNIF